MVRVGVMRVASGEVRRGRTSYDSLRRMHAELCTTHASYSARRRTFCEGRRIFDNLKASPHAADPCAPKKVGTSQAFVSPNWLFVWVVFFGSTFSCFFTIFIHFGRLWEVCGVLWGLILGVKIEKHGVWDTKWSQVGSRRVLPQCPYPILEAFWVPKIFSGGRLYTSGGPKFSRMPQKTRFFNGVFPVYSQLVPGTTDSSFFFSWKIDENGWKWL